MLIKMQIINSLSNSSILVLPAKKKYLAGLNMTRGTIESAVLWCSILMSRVLRNSHLQVFLGKGILKICSKFTGEHPCRTVISRKLLFSFIEIALRHGCSLVNLLLIFRALFCNNKCGELLLGGSLTPCFSSKLPNSSVC